MSEDSRLSEPGRTLSSLRSLFEEQADDKYRSWLQVHEQIKKVAATRSAPAAALTRKHEIFRAGLSGWLESVVKLVSDEVALLSKIGARHPTWLGDADPAQWARSHVQGFLRESLRQEVSTHSLNRAFREGTSLLRSKDDPSSNDSRPAVEIWFRIASEGQKYYGLSLPPRSAKPWRAPFWCYQSFSVPLWSKWGKPSHLTDKQTEIEIRSAQSKFAGRLEYVLDQAEDLQRVECASIGSTHIDSSPPGLPDPQPRQSGSESAAGRTEISSAAKPSKSNVGRNIDRLRNDCGWSFNDLAKQTLLEKKLILGHVNKGKGIRPNTLKLYADAFTKGLGRKVTATDLLES
jgi:hypothetical protein